MVLSTEKALRDIDRVLAATPSEVSRNIGYGMKSEIGARERAVLLEACICRYARPGSPYRRAAVRSFDSKHTASSLIANKLSEILAALRVDIEAGHLNDFEVEVRTNSFAGFLAQASELNSKGYVRPAAALAGAALEEHLHLLCERHDVPVQDENGTRYQASKLNQDLKRAGVYEASDRDHVDTWQKIRNRAVHPKKDEDEEFEVAFSKNKIRRMIDGIEELILDGRAGLIALPH